eukprot:1076655-Amphidinium_carterae.2
MKRGMHTVWTDGSGRHNSNPHFRRCGVGYVTDTDERAWLLLPGCWQWVFRAELLGVARHDAVDDEVQHPEAEPQDRHPEAEPQGIG